MCRDCFRDCGHSDEISAHNAYHANLRRGLICGSTPVCIYAFSKRGICRFNNGANSSAVEISQIDEICTSNRTHGSERNMIFDEDWLANLVIRIDSTARVCKDDDRATRFHCCSHSVDNRLDAFSFIKMCTSKEDQDVAIGMST